MHYFIKVENSMYVVVDTIINQPVASFAEETDAHKFIQSLLQLPIQNKPIQYMQAKFPSTMAKNFQENVIMQPQIPTTKVNKSKNNKLSNFEIEVNSKANGIDENYIRRIVAEMQRDVLIQEKVLRERHHITKTQVLSPQFIKSQAAIDYTQDLTETQDFEIESTAYKKPVQTLKRKAQEELIEVDEIFEEIITPETNTKKQSPTTQVATPKQVSQASELQKHKPAELFDGTEKNVLTETVNKEIDIKELEILEKQKKLEELEAQLAQKEEALKQPQQPDKVKKTEEIKIASTNDLLANYNQPTQTNESDLEKIVNKRYAIYDEKAQGTIHANNSEAVNSGDFDLRKSAQQLWKLHEEDFKKNNPEAANIYDIPTPTELNATKQMHENNGQQNLVENAVSSEIKDGQVISETNKKNSINEDFFVDWSSSESMLEKKIKEVENKSEAHNRGNQTYSTNSHYSSRDVNTDKNLDTENDFADETEPLSDNKTSNENLSKKELKKLNKKQNKEQLFVDEKQESFVEATNDSFQQKDDKQVTDDSQNKQANLRDAEFKNKAINAQAENILNNENSHEKGTDLVNQSSNNGSKKTDEENNKSFENSSIITGEKILKNLASENNKQNLLSQNSALTNTKQNEQLQTNNQSNKKDLESKNENNSVDGQTMLTEVFDEKTKQEDASIKLSDSNADKNDKKNKKLNKKLAREEKKLNKEKKEKKKETELENTNLDEDKNIEYEARKESNILNDEDNIKALQEAVAKKNADFFQNKQNTNSKVASQEPIEPKTTSEIENKQQESALSELNDNTINNKNKNATLDHETLGDVSEGKENPTDDKKLVAESNIQTQNETKNRGIPQENKNVPGFGAHNTLGENHNLDSNEKIIDSTNKDLLVDGQKLSNNTDATETNQSETFDDIIKNDSSNNKWLKNSNNEIKKPHQPNPTLGDQSSQQPDELNAVEQVVATPNQNSHPLEKSEENNDTSSDFSTNNNHSPTKNTTNSPNQPNPTLGDQSSQQPDELNAVEQVVATPNQNSHPLEKSEENNDTSSDFSTNNNHSPTKNTTNSLDQSGDVVPNNIIQPQSQASNLPFVNDSQNSVTPLNQQPQNSQLQNNAIPQNQQTYGSGWNPNQTNYQQPQPINNNQQPYNNPFNQRADYNNPNISQNPYQPTPNIAANQPYNNPYLNNGQGFDNQQFQSAPNNYVPQNPLGNNSEWNPNQTNYQQPQPMYNNAQAMNQPIQPNPNNYGQKNNWYQEGVWSPNQPLNNPPLNEQQIQVINGPEWNPNQTNYKQPQPMYNNLQPSNSREQQTAYGDESLHKNYYQDGMNPQQNYQEYTNQKPKKPLGIQNNDSIAQPNNNPKNYDPQDIQKDKEYQNYQSQQPHNSKWDDPETLNQEYGPKYLTQPNRQSNPAYQNDWSDDLFNIDNSGEWTEENPDWETTQSFEAVVEPKQTKYSNQDVLTKLKNGDILEEELLVNSANTPYNYNNEDNDASFNDDMLFGGIMLFNNNTDDDSLGEVAAFSKAERKNFVHNPQQQIQRDEQVNLRQNVSLQDLSKSTSTNSYEHKTNEANQPKTAIVESFVETQKAMGAEKGADLNDIFNDYLEPVLDVKNNLNKNSVEQNTSWSSQQSPLNKISSISGSSTSRNSIIDLGPIEEEEISFESVAKPEEEIEKLTKEELKALAKAKKAAEKQRRRGK